MQKIWFKRKRYGYGWVPSTWQGWLIVLAYVLSIAFFGNLAKAYTSTADIVIGFVIPTVVFTILLLIVCWATGEKPRWQWGKDRE